MRRTIALVTSCVLAVGCAESHGPPLDAAELPEIMARAYCETLAECSMTQLSTGSDPLPWIDVEQCVRSSIYAREWQRRAAPWVEAVERGDAWIDSTEVARCVDAVHDATCLIDVRYQAGREAFPYTLPHEAGAPGLPGFHPSCSSGASGCPSARSARDRSTASRAHTVKGRSTRRRGAWPRAERETRARTEARAVPSSCASRAGACGGSCSGPPPRGSPAAGSTTAPAA